MNVLVASASRYGATDGIARAIAEVLTEAGHDVTVASCDEAPDAAAFDAVVVGSAVYAGHWLEVAKELVTGSAEVLRSRPVWLFSSGPVGDPPKPDEDPVGALGIGSGRWRRFGLAACIVSTPALIVDAGDTFAGLAVNLGLAALLFRAHGNDASFPVAGRMAMELRRPR